MTRSSKASGAKSSTGPTPDDKPTERELPDRSVRDGGIGGGEAQKPGESVHDAHRKEKT
jgi:hypothetical protein